MRKMWSSAEDLVEGLVQFDRRLQVASERLLDDDPTALVQADGSELRRDGGEHGRRDRHVEHGDQSSCAGRAWRAARSRCSRRSSRPARGRVARTASRRRPDRARRCARRSTRGRARRKSSSVQSLRATPITGTFSTPDRSSRYSAGNNLRTARSPVAPNSTSASASGWLVCIRPVSMCVAVADGWSAHRVVSFVSTWPPKPARIADSTWSATSERPRD